jgi:hypothetical protein
MGSSSCDAMRAGAFKASLSRLPFARFHLTFLGTGSAELPSDQLSELAEQVHESGRASMHWTRNRFLGHHWLFGSVSIELDERMDSIGEFTDFRVENGRTKARNINRFYFKLRSARFPRFTLRTKEPVVNAADIDAIPPVGSRFSLVESHSVKLSRQTNNSAESEFGSLNFKFCDVTAFPERNISIDINSVSYSSLIATISVRIANLTDKKVRATYFVVDHSENLAPNGDAIFFDLAPGARKDLSFSVISKIHGLKESLPLFAGIHKPEQLQGSATTSLDLEF